MSQENVEFVRQSFEVWNKGAYAEWKSMHHPSVIVVPPEDWPESQTSENRDAWFSQAMRLTDSWEEQRVEVEDLHDLGDHVLAMVRWVTRGKGSHIDLETPMAAVITISEGQIVRADYFLEREQALEAIGLRE